jgi:pimeloyl-ACP methyl ester carboxylesterase
MADGVVGDGDGPPPAPDEARPDLVLVHGLGSAASYWDNLLAALADRFTVHTPNLPGHGPAAGRVRADEAHPRDLARAVIAGLERDGVEAPHLVGLSLGGWVVLEMAALGYGASVVALAPAGFYRPGAMIRGEHKEALVHHLLGGLRPVLPALTRLGVVRQLGLRANVANAAAVTHDQLAAAAVALADARGFAMLDRAAVEHRFESAADVGVPVTVAFGDRDLVLPGPDCQERSLAPEQAEWVVVSNCGHAMTWDQPAACLELIDRTVARAATTA